MPRPIRFVAISALVVGLLGVATLALRSTGSNGQAQVLAPPFELTDVRQPGEIVSFAGDEGVPTVVNFLASWCIPCRDELPEFEAASVRIGDKVRFVGVDHQDSKSGATKLLDDVGVTFPVGYDPKGSVGGRYRLRGMPTTIFIDAKGREVGRIAGRLAAADLDVWLDRLTKGSG